MTTILQDEAEIAAFVELLHRERITSYLEIGSKFGGSLNRVAEILPERSKIVSVDLPNGTKAWPESKLSLESLIDSLKAHGHEAHLIWGNSADPEVIAKVKALGPFDAILIDADHRLAGVTADWKNYGPLGRIVAFHDIAWHRAPEWQGTRIDVPEFWDSIKDAYQYEEIVLCPTGKNNGIGVLWRS